MKDIITIRDLEINQLLFAKGITPFQTNAIGNMYYVDKNLLVAFLKIILDGRINEITLVKTKINH